MLVERSKRLSDLGSNKGMVEAPLGANRIRNIYNLASHIYFLARFIEEKHHMRALKLAQIQPQDRVLEVAVGLGYTFSRILATVNRDNTVHGIDLSPKMLARTRRLVQQKGFTNFDLREGDARRLPYPDESFDLVYNSYMLDLTPLADIPVVLAEFHRVLKNGGRLVLVNFSKKDSSPVLAEKLYKLNPALLFGCRPVLMETFLPENGFENVVREYPKFFLSLPSEIVTGSKKQESQQGEIK